LEGGNTKEEEKEAEEEGNGANQLPGDSLMKL